MTKTYSVISILTAAAMGSFLVGCAADEGDGNDVITPGTNTGGTAPVAGTGGTAPVGTGGAAATGGGTGTGGTVDAAGSLFDGAGSWVDGANNTVGIQGSFFVLEDSVKDGTPVADTLVHTDLTPDEFDDATIKPCVSGTVGSVTGSGGEDCSAAGVDCDYSALWGGGIGLNLNEPGGVDSVASPWDATANGVTGFKFTVSGEYTGTVRFKAKVNGMDEEDFCISIDTGVETTVLFSELKHMCWGDEGDATLFDPTNLVQLQWQVVSAQGTPHTVADLCIENLAFVK